MRVSVHPFQTKVSGHDARMYGFFLSVRSLGTEQTQFLFFGCGVFSADARNLIVAVSFNVAAAICLVLVADSSV